jgi:hypothetical protein
LREPRTRRKPSPPEAVYDKAGDTLYVILRRREDGYEYSYGIDLDDERGVDYTADHVPIGILFLDVSKGVKLDDVPESERILPLLQTHGIKILSNP